VGRPSVAGEKEVGRIVGEALKGLRVDRQAGEPVTVDPADDASDAVLIADGGVTAEQHVAAVYLAPASPADPPEGRSDAAGVRVFPDVWRPFAGHGGSFPAG